MPVLCVRAVDIGGVNKSADAVHLLANARVVDLVVGSVQGDDLSACVCGVELRVSNWHADVEAHDGIRSVSKVNVMINKLAPLPEVV